jgi:hypothetical protein
MAITGRILTWRECKPVDFIRRWENLAEGPGSRLYESHPGAERLTQAHLVRLYPLWNDRSRPTAQDRKEVSLLASSLQALNAFRVKGRPQETDVLDLYDELTHNAGRRLSLKLFALHAALPLVFPPFSRARLAAYEVFTGETVGKPPVFNEDLLPTYFVYQNFFFGLLKAGVADAARLDRALLAVGQFMERYGTCVAG